MRGEFDLIARYFAPLSENAPGAEGLKNDAALFRPGHEAGLVVTADMMVEGVHFLPEDPPELIGRKLLRVNLSDLAAMGAEPRGYLLTVALPAAIEEAWVEAFAAGLAEDQREFGVALHGGDTVATPGPLTLSLTAFGDAFQGRVLARSTARVGDLVYVSGTIGDGARATWSRPRRSEEMIGTSWSWRCSTFARRRKAGWRSTNTSSGTACWTIARARAYPCPEVPKKPSG